MQDMEKEKQVTAFLQELTSLSQKYGIYIKGFASDKPWLVGQDKTPVAGELTYNFRKKLYTVEPAEI